MQAAFEALVNNAEDATNRLSAALEAIGTLGEGAEGILAALAAKQPKNDTLDAISLLGPDPGVLEQIQAGIFSIRPIDAADVKSLVSRELGDSRWLGGAHGAVSAAKWTTARSITITGDGAWTVTVDGSANVSAGLTLATVNANTGTFGGAKTSVQVSLDGKGRVTSASAITITPDYSSIGIVPTSRFLGRVTAGTGSAEALTGTQATTLLDTFTSALKGLAPASGGGTANFLRADGTWAAPAAPTGAALTKADDTNVTLTLGGTPASALLQAVSVTVGWTGILAAARGGTANGFTAFSGPATSTKTFTLPNASDTIGCLGQAQSWTAKQTFTGSGDDHVSVVGSGTGRSGFYAKASSTTGNATFYFENDRGGFASYGGLLTGGSANASTFFGLTRADKTFLIHDGASGLGLGIGTLNNTPIVFGTNNVERGRIDSTGLNLVTGCVYKVNSTQVVGPRGAAVADATNATDVITQLNALLARCRAHGLIA
jgi:hypothetical protein